MFDFKEGGVEVINERERIALEAVRKRIINERERIALEAVRKRADSAYSTTSHINVLKNIHEILGGVVRRLESGASPAVDPAAPDGDRTAAIVIEPDGDPNANAGDDLRAIIDAWNKEFHVSIYTSEENDSFRAWYDGLSAAVVAARRNALASVRTGLPKFSDVEKAVAAMYPPTAQGGGNPAAH